MTEVDPDTGELDAINRRAELEAIVQSEMVSAPGFFAVVAIDLDELKEINDSENHASGDAYIITARDVLQAYVRQPNPQDPDYREGDVIVEGRTIHTNGDEYWVIIRNVNLQEQVSAFIERMQEILDDYGIGASMGGRVHIPGEHVSDLLNDADNLMHNNKLQRALIEYKLTLEQEVAFRAGVAVITSLGISLRNASKLLEALDMRDNGQASH